MICPKCNQSVLEEGKKNRWYCPYIYPNEYKIVKKKDGTEDIKEIKGQPCNFACGLAFFVEDESAEIKAEVGISIENLHLSSRAQAIINSGVLGLNEIDRTDQVEKLQEIKDIEKKEEEWDEYNAMMREVVGRSPAVHRTLSNGESYSKIQGGGLISKKLS